MEDQSVERAARNEAVFRDANEVLEARAAELSAIAGRTPYLCECADPYCRDVILLTREEYEAVRGAANRFFLAPGHRTAEAETVAATDRYVVVEKHGVAREVAEETNPRQ